MENFFRLNSNGKMLLGVSKHDGEYLDDSESTIRASPSVNMFSLVRCNVILWAKRHFKLRKFNCG